MPPRISSHEAFASHHRSVHLSPPPSNPPSTSLHGLADPLVGQIPFYPKPITSGHSVQATDQTNRPARFPRRGLAWSRESAKRLLHTRSPHNHSSVTAEGMVSADQRRQSPARRNRDANTGDPSRAGSTQSRSQSYNSTLSALCDEKPIASGNGISIGISLAESVLYLQGFDQNDNSSGSTTMLRGSLHLHVTKQVKLKSISLNFRGRAETNWPEGVPPRKTEYRDGETVINHTWPFFHAHFPQAEYGYCADLVHLAKSPAVSTKELGVTASSFDRFHRSASPRQDILSRESSRLSLQLNPSRSFGKADAIHSGPTVAQKGFKVFHPGDYVYNFELPVDSRLPETINVALGHVKYELEALVERSGAFRANLIGTKELLMVRAPAEGSLEQVEPIAISRNWEDQLHYDIVVSGKSFPLGASVPIAFKLTPLAKVHCHRIKIYVTENVQYFTVNKRVHRIEPTSTVQLFEKRSDAPSNSTFPGSTIRVNAGGGIAWDDREAAAAGEEIVQRGATNLLGNLENDNASIGPTEMEFSIKLPSCHEMKDRPKQERLHFDTTYSNIQVNHWIKIVMRLSKRDETNSAKRRHFEVSIDSPLNILSCRATAANTSLPAYTSGRAPVPLADEFDCGCPGAAMKRRNTPPPQVVNDHPDTFSTGPASNWSDNAAGLATLVPAHVHDPSTGVQDANSGVSRPIHLLRSPSFNPPPFSDEEPPPPLMTPPPQYENIVSGDSRHALADYFSRLADEMGDEDEAGDRGRVNIPLTPGGRIHRSMDVDRTWLPLGTSPGG